MAEKELSKEQIEALQNCKDAKAVMALAKEKGIELSEEQAGKLYAALQNDKLTDEDLQKVVGGCLVVKSDKRVETGIVWKN